MTTTTALTSTERSRRRRAAQYEAQDSVRSFLDAVIASANDAVVASTPREDDEPGTKYPEVEPFRLARADTARDLLDLLDATSPGPQLTFRGRGLNLSEDDERLLYDPHVRAFDRYRLIPGNVTRAAARDEASPTVALAQTSLKWAADLLAQGKGTSPVLAQGLRAAKRLIERPRSKALTDAFAQYTSDVNTSEFIQMLNALKQGFFPSIEHFLAADERVGRGAHAAQEGNDDDATQTNTDD
jgi:hypothetical protein